MGMTALRSREPLTWLDRWNIKSGFASSTRARAASGSEIVGPPANVRARPSVREAACTDRTGLEQPLAETRADEAGGARHQRALSVE